MFSRPKATSFATRIITIWSSGSWNTEATCPASWAGVASRVSRPHTTTRPENVPPWKCGTRPASARTSVDLPEPDGPSSDDVLAVGDLERDAVERDVAVGVGEAQVVDDRYSHSAPTTISTTEATSAARSRCRHGGRGACVRGPLP